MELITYAVQCFMGVAKVSQIDLGSMGQQGNEEEEEQVMVDEKCPSNS